MFMVITVILSHWKGVKYCCVWSQFSQDVFQTCCSKSCLGLLSMNLPSLLKFMGHNCISITSLTKQSTHLSTLASLYMLLNYMLSGTHDTFCYNWILWMPRKRCFMCSLHLVSKRLLVWHAPSHIHMIYNIHQGFAGLFFLEWFSSLVGDESSCHI